ncbi:MBL fold metallo-hydrolase [Anaerovorax odorimutans]|uniref:MBL fold metallo-hydrolase n=1 Tax=Anaerovorax odorimutans TaxID=109327 RepID=UPI0003FF5AF3|nr:MBL fold metallo-hydrolase [Anaerovorax odorimutans]
MTLNFCSFSSGSSGNCYLIKSQNTALLVDAGISGKKILEGLEKTKTNLEFLSALLITHEHSDHTKSIKTLTKKHNNLNVYANKKTWEMINKDICKDQMKTFDTGKIFTIGDIRVKPFKVSHDAADPVGFSFYSRDKQISVVTDTGYMNDEILCEVENADILILEANHDIEMLKIGKYPWFLKQRVLGDEGHLSNEAAGQAIVKLLTKNKKERRILLGHLSRENNFPEMAYQTVKNILEEANYYIGKHVYLNTIIRDEISRTYEI